MKTIPNIVIKCFLLLVNPCLIAAISFLVLSCAQQVSPSGGVKDTTPPQIVKSTPENFSLNFSGNKIELKFDEFVQFKSIDQQLIISPSINIKPKPKLSGKKATINLGDSLKPNTTYQVNFGGGIVDWNEGNILDSNLFIFSTGDYIDSLFIEGVVKNAFSHLPVQGVAVMLYESFNDSIPYKKIPTYFDITDDKGVFTIDYLKGGEYKIFALKDLNNNYLFDNKEEQIAFSKNIHIPIDTSQFILDLFTETPLRNQFIKSAKMVGYRHFRIVLNEPTLDFNLKVLNTQFKKPWNIQDVFTNKDTIDYWFTDMEGLDSLDFEIMDSLVLDTVSISLNKEKKDSLLSIKLNVNSSNHIAPFNSLVLLFNEPIINPVAEGIKIRRVSDSTLVPVSISEISNNQRRVTLDFEKIPSERYSVSVLPNQFKSIFNNGNDTLKKTILVNDYNLYSTLKFEILLDSLVNTTDNYVVQLLNDKKKVIRETTITNSKVIDFENLTSGKYTVLLIFDKNNNQRWDTGNYMEQIQPEKVIVYDGVIDIKGGWDQEISWTLKD